MADSARSCGRCQQPIALDERTNWHMPFESGSELGFVAEHESVDRCIAALLAEVERLRAPVVVTDAMVTRAAKALAKDHAEMCGVDERDAWNIYGAGFRETATKALTAALSTPHPGGG